MTIGQLNKKNTPSAGVCVIKKNLLNNKKNFNLQPGNHRKNSLDP